MAEKKATTKAATAKKATATKKAVAKDAVLYVNAESVGFRAGDVYQALAAADKALSIAEIAKDANISAEEAYLGIGWLFKEGKVKDEDNLITLA
ncbi:winged helix-turn-helix domain-containing protein [Segatella paludivivens]|uniref:winged helix-turn-helix domain-containing protein n=1 Tax=Segatella paludivivens TaxID=185294 RepID=UPI00036C142A|nr:winged helix-turn-helix domain-containing protein [Segatella paludivivens]